MANIKQQVTSVLCRGVIMSVTHAFTPRSPNTKMSEENKEYEVGQSFLFQCWNLLNET